MRRLVIALVATCTYVFASAQSCTPDQNITSPGFFPKDLEVAYVDSAYKQVLQIRVFKDTTVNLPGQGSVYATVDSINLIGFEGYPQSTFYYTCSAPNCSYTPDSTGCATLQGTPTKAQVGVYPLDIYIEIFGKAFGTFPTSMVDTLDQFSLVINEFGNSSIQPNDLNHLQISPNPSNGSFDLSAFAPYGIKSVVCRNSLGQIVESQVDANKLRLSNAVNGMYSIHLTTAQGQHFRQKIQVLH